MMQKMIPLGRIHSGSGPKPKVFPLIFALLPAVLLISGCSVEKPSAPSWDVDVTIPLINRSYTMTELADDEESLFVDGDGMLGFSETVDLENYYVGDELDVEDVESSFNQELGDINIDSPGSEFVDIQLREIYSQADPLHGQDVVIEGFAFATDKRVLDTFEDFDYVKVKSGSIDLLLHNNLIIPLGSPVTLEIWDAVLDTLVGSTTRAIQIPPGQSHQFIMNLSGKRMPSNLAVVVEGATPGSDGAQVTVDANSSFTVEAEISDMVVTEAIATVPGQTVADEDYVDISDSLMVVEAEIENGRIELDLNTNFSIDAWLSYELPDFITPSGSVLKDSVLLNRNSEEHISIDLQDHTLQPVEADFGEQQFRFHWTARTIDTGTNKVLVRSSDVVQADFRIRDLRFTQVTGKLGEQEIDITQDDIEIDIPADLDSVFFETARLELRFNNRINFPANLSLNIHGQNEAGARTELQVEEVIQAAGIPGGMNTSVIVLDQQNSNIKDFVSILPSLISVEGKVKLGDTSWIGTVTKDDYVNGEVNITAPLAVSLPEQNFETDPSEMDIDEDVQDDIIDNLANGSFHAEIDNHLPMGATVDLVFCESDSTLFISPLLTIGPLAPESPGVDGSGYVQAARKSEIFFDLTEEQMKTFLRKPLYMGLRILLDGTDGQYVKVRASDFIQIKAHSRIQVKVNQD